MKGLSWLIALFAAAVGLAILARYNHGYVLVTYPPYRLEFSLNFLIIVVLAVFLILHAAVSIATTTLHLPEKVRAYRLHRARNRARSMMHDALTAYFEGRYSAAEKAAAGALAHGEWPALSSVIAARAAHQLRRYEQRDNYLKLVDAAGPEAQLLRPITQAELLISEARITEALEALKEVHRISPKSVAALRLTLKAQIAAKNWDEVLELVERLVRVNGIDPIYAEQVSQNAYVELLNAKAYDLQALRNAWHTVPVDLRVQRAITLTAAKHLITHGDTREAAKIIEASLEHQWDSTVIELYGDCLSRNALPQIEKAESWLKKHPEDAMLLKTLGKLCARQSLWGKARSYLEASLAVEANQATHIALAQLLETIGRRDEALAHYRESLTLDRRDWQIAAEDIHQTPVFASASADKVKASE